MAETVQNLDFYTQALPYSLEAEQSVLGAILIDAGCLPPVMEVLRAEHFYREQHQNLFSLLTRMFTMGETIDFVTVLDGARKESIFPSPEDAKVYLAQLAQVVPTTANVMAYTRIVQEKYYLRTLIVTSREIVDTAFDAQADAAALLDFAEQRIFDIRQGRETSGVLPLQKVLVETYEHLQRVSGADRNEYLGISTGYKALDGLITGLNKSDLILIAARPGVGKTSLALNIAANVGIHSGNGQGTAGPAVFVLRGAGGKPEADAGHPQRRRLGPHRPGHPGAGGGPHLCGRHGGHHRGGN